MFESIWNTYLSFCALQCVSTYVLLTSPACIISPLIWNTKYINISNFILVNVTGEENELLNNYNIYMPTWSKKQLQLAKQIDEPCAINFLKSKGFIDVESNANVYGVDISEIKNGVFSTIEVKNDAPLIFLNPTQSPNFYILIYRGKWPNESLKDAKVTEFLSSEDFYKKFKLTCLDRYTGRYGYNGNKPFSKNSYEKGLSVGMMSWVDDVSLTIEQFTLLLEIKNEHIKKDIENLKKRK